MRKIIYNLTLALSLVLIVVSVDAKQNLTGSSAGDFAKVGAAGSQFLKIGMARISA